MTAITMHGVTVETDMSLSNIISAMEMLGEAKPEDNGIAYVREQYLEHFKRDTRLSNDQLLFLMAVSEDDRDDWPDYLASIEVAIDEAASKPKLPEIKKANAKSKATATSPIIKGAERGYRPLNAVALSNKLTDDKALDQELKVLLKQKEDVAVGGMDVYFHLTRIFTSDELASMPVPGTEEKDVVGTNLPYDKYDIPAPDGSGRVKGSFFKDLAMGIPEMASLQQKLKDYAEQNKGSKSPADYKFRTPLISRQNYILRLLRQAWELWAQKQACENLQWIEITFETRTEKVNGVEITKADGQTPIKVFDSKEKVSRWYTIGSFLALKPEKATAGTLAALSETNKKGRSKNNGQAPVGAGKVKAAATLLEWQDCMVAGSHFFSTANNALIYKSLLDGKPEDREDYVKTLNAYCVFFAQLRPMIADQVRDIERREEEAERKAKEETEASLKKERKERQVM